MNFKVIRFATTRISVSNVSRSREWYRNLFGMDPIESLEDFVSFEIAGTCFDICLADEKSPQSRGGTVGYWLVDSIDALIISAKALGGSVYRGPLQVAETGRVILQIIDPDGNVVGFEAPLQR